jgi:FkbM family methyltransferase
VNHLETAVRVLRSGLPIRNDSSWLRPFASTYEWLLESLYGRRGLTRTLNGEETIRVRPAFRALREDVEPVVFRTLRRLVTPGMAVLDVGASYGIFTIVLARWCAPSGRVIAFEPTPVSRSALRDHLILNGLADRVEIVDAAVSDRVGSATLYAVGRSGENTLNAAYFSREDGAEAIQVPATTIDAYCRSHGVTPGVIKIDIEGFEFHALRGAVETLERCRPAVVIELHAASWRGVGEDAAEAERLIAAVSYRVVPLEGQRAPFKEGGHVLLEPNS